MANPSLYRYQQPDGLCNYLQFHDDVMGCTILTNTTPSLGNSVIVDNVDDSGHSSLQYILSKINNAVFKNGVRTTEFFKDHDKLNSGVITENQVILSHMVICVMYFIMYSLFVDCHSTVVN